MMKVIILVFISIIVFVLVFATYQYRYDGTYDLELNENGVNTVTRIPELPYFAIHRKCHSNIKLNEHGYNVINKKYPNKISKDYKFVDFFGRKYLVSCIEDNGGNDNSFYMEFDVKDKLGYFIFAGIGPSKKIFDVYMK